MQGLRIQVFMVHGLYGVSGMFRVGLKGSELCASWMSIGFPRRQNPPHAGVDEDRDVRPARPAAG